MYKAKQRALLRGLQSAVDHTDELKKNKILTEDEKKASEDVYYDHVKLMTDLIICEYLAKINNLRAKDIFSDLPTEISKVYFDKQKYLVHFEICDVKTFSLGRPAKTDPKEFHRMLTYLDDIIRIKKVFNKRYEEYTQFLNKQDEKSVHTKMFSGGKLFLRAKDNMYYLGNKHMKPEHIAFVKNMTELPFAIGIVIEKNPNYGIKK